MPDITFKGSDGKCIRFSLFFTDGQDKWNFVELGVAHFTVQAFGSTVDLDPQPCVFKFYFYRVGIGYDFVIDGQNDSLDGGQP